MRKTILIGKDKDRELELLANAATPIRFRDLFHADLLTLLHNAERDDGYDLTVASEVAPELAYVMARAADGTDMTQLSVKDYMAWLEQFEPMDFINGVEAIFNVYFGDMETEVDPKKKGKGKANGS